MVFRVVYLLTAPELGAAVIRESIQRVGVKPEQVDEVIFGCVLSAGIGQGPASSSHAQSWRA